MNQPSQDALGWPRPLARQAGLGWPVPGESPETAEDELADEVGAEIQDTDVQRPYFAEPTAEKLPPVSRETREDPAEAESATIESTPAVSRETSADEPANSQMAGDASEEILGAAISADELGPSGEDDAPAAPPVPRETLPHPAQPRVLVIANQKGGVGKTTTAVNIATALALGDQRVLVVDLDPQGNASTALGVDHEPGTPGTYEVLIEGAAVADHVKLSAEADNLWVLPATVDLAAAEIELVSTVARESRLAKALRRYLRDHDVDYVFLDCPPSLGLLTLNALVAAEEILIPIQCEYYALEGVVLALDRDQDLLRRDQRVQGEQAQRRGAVQEDVVDVVVAEIAPERLGQPGFPGDGGDQLDLGRGQVDRGRQHPEVVRLGRELHVVGDGRPLDQHLVSARRTRFMIDPEGGRGVALRVEVHDQHPLVTQRQCRRDVHRGRGLADPALLIGDHQDPRLCRVRQCFTWNGRCGRGVVLAGWAELVRGDGGTKDLFRRITGHLAVGRLVRRCFT